MSTATAFKKSKGRSFGGPDAVLASIVIGIVGLMIVPLPTWLLDLLIAANIAIGVTVLLVTLFITDALKIGAFPSLLLITTLYRLALNVSSTRLILLQGDAGDMISAFGNFVVRGNYVVGAVIFLILTIIQFIVIAKGSERVAEVGARFTLDAMPGKQMSIDAEARAGGIDAEEAKRQRRNLSRESQFYGAMDGAMKFVKGDTIASLIMTAVNLLGGLAVGVGQRGMGAGDAFKKYGLLTIGDGLVSQLPALVLSTAAGILVTRVASEEPDTALGKELSVQLLRSPKALKVAGGFIAALGLVPGLPTIPLVVIGGSLIWASLVKTKADPGGAKARTPVQQNAEGSAHFIPVVTPWAIQVSEDLSKVVEDEMRGENVERPGIRSAANAVRELVFRELGVVLPVGDVEVLDDAPPRHVILAIQEVPSMVFQLDESVKKNDMAQHIVDTVLPVLKSRATEFLGISETQVLLDRLETVAPATVRQVTPKPVTISLLADVLRRLVEEEVSIRDLKGILEALVQVANADKDPLNLTEFVRSHLRRAITYQITGGSGSLNMILLSPEVEEGIRDAVSRTSAGTFLTLSPSAARDIGTAVQRAYDAAEIEDKASIVVVTQPDVRRFVRKLVEGQLPQLKVISFPELLPEIALQTVGTATVRGL